MSSVKGLPLRSGGGGFRWWFISCLSGVINVWRCDLRLLTSKARARLYLGMIKAGSVCSPVDTGKGSVSSQLIYIVFLGCVLSGQVPNFLFIYFLDGHGGCLLLHFYVALNSTLMSIRCKKPAGQAMI